VIAEPLLQVDGLFVTYGTKPAVHAVSFDIGRQQAMGLVGESGSGKTTVALALMRYLPPTGHVRGGRVRFDGQDVLNLDSAALRAFRGRRVAMVYQNPGAALNPSTVVGDQVAEVFTSHSRVKRSDARRQALTLLNQVQLPDPELVYRQYPHQLSGGMQQRVVIAMALAAHPDLLILDEPTSGLDATVQAAILALLTDLRRQFATAILLISHNLAVVAQVCEHIGVMYAGRLVEQGSVNSVFDTPAHPYTRGLLASLPGPGARKGSAPLESIRGQPASAGSSEPGCLFAPRCNFARDRCREAEPTLLSVAHESPTHGSRCYFWEEVRSAPRPIAQSNVAPPSSMQPTEQLLDANGIRKEYRADRTRVVALDSVSLEIPAGRTVGLVGESGSGKSTMARVIAGLDPLDSGALTWRERPLSRSLQQRPRAFLRQLQMVFQDPDSTLNPRQTVRTLLERSLRKLTNLDRSARNTRAVELLDAVELDSRLLGALPRELSGGQRQRVAIARAFAGAPALVLCDEPTSALDASVQATVLNLLDALQRQSGTAYLFISHDIGVVRYLGDAVGVLYLGRVMQFGSVESVFAPPHHPYTEVLLASEPRRSRQAGAEQSTRERAPRSRPTRGCPYQDVCPRKLGSICETDAPPWRETPDGGGLLCHIPLAELRAMQSPT
jgi:peptide/nickel transport system ATP-binding protein